MSKPIKLYAVGVIVGIIVVLIIYAFLPKNETTWEQVKGTSYQASFPLKPNYESNELPISGSDIKVNEERYTIEEPNGMAYLVVADVYPTSLSEIPVEETLQNALQGMVATSPNNELITSEFLNRDEQTGINFLIEDKKQNLFYKGKLIVGEKTLYQIFVTYYPQEYNEEKFQTFQNAFQLLPL